MAIQGATDAEIAESLHLSAKQLTKEWDAITRDLGVLTREEAVDLIVAKLVAEARTALAVRQNELALILRAPEDRAILTFNAHGIITGISRYSEHLLGVPAERVIGQPIDVFLTGRAKGIQQTVEELDRAEAGEHVKSTRAHMRGDGTSFVAEHSLVAIIGPTDHVEGFVREIYDVTNRRIHQLKIKELSATLALLIED